MTTNFGGYRIFDGSPGEENIENDHLEFAIRKIDNDIDLIDPKLMSIVNTERARAIRILLNKGLQYTPVWTTVKRDDIKPKRAYYEADQFSFSGRDNISLHIPGLEIQTLRKRKPQNHVLYDIRISYHGKLREVTLSHKEYNLLKKFVGALGNTIKIINKDRYTLTELISNIGTGIIGKREGTNLCGIPFQIPAPESTTIDSDKNSVLLDEEGNPIPEFIYAFGKRIKNPKWVKRIQEVRSEEK